ncbi:hypothetical protein TNCV_1643381 [Trichonephila clavipes]|nr:hypothetical protein TNCV_1643381 [Trichonephila clavipes]
MIVWEYYEWFSRLKSGNMSTKDMLYPRSPSIGRNDENISKIKRAIGDYWGNINDQVSEETTLSSRFV